MEQGIIKFSTYSMALGASLHEDLLAILSIACRDAHCGSAIECYKILLNVIHILHVENNYLTISISFHNEKDFKYLKTQISWQSKGYYLQLCNN